MHIAKKMLAVAVLAVSLTSIVMPSEVQARSLADIKSAGTINIVTEGAYAPFNYFEGKDLVGYEIEVAEAVAKQMGLKIKWEIVPFDAQVAAIGQGRFDLAIASHGFSEERAQSVDFANPHYCSGGIIVSSKDGALTAEAIAGKVASAQIGTSYLANLEKIGTLKEIKTYRSDPEAFLALKNKRVDVWVSDRFTALETLATDKDKNFVTGDLLFKEEVSAIFPKNNKDLLDAWNKALAEVINDGTIAKISQKLFEQDITCK